MRYVPVHDSPEPGAALLDRHCIVDDSLYEAVASWQWFLYEYRGPLRHYRRKSYVARQQEQPGVRPIVYLLQNQVLRFAGYHSRYPAWHIDGNIYNNRLINLTTRRFKVPQAGQSRYQGVSWDAKSSQWRVECVQLTPSVIGQFKDEFEAAKAYDRAVFGALKNTARLNFCDLVLDGPQ